MILPGFGADGQDAMLNAHVFIVGVGGLGSPAAIYLAAAGIGEITLLDFDRVSISNLHRQILYTENDIGQKKVKAAAARLHAINPNLDIHTIDSKLSTEELTQAIRNADAVLDCSDNFVTRHSVNVACVKNKIPLISGAAIRFEAQIAVFNQKNDSPCYACLYPHATDEAERCSEVGVLGPLVGMIGSMQAMEAMKLITAVGEPLNSRLIVFDAKTMDWRSLRLSKDSNCKVCAS